MNAPLFDVSDSLASSLLPVFFEELTKRRDGLNDVLKDLRKGVFGEEQSASLKLLAHKITGSSAPFGFPELGLMGERLGTLLKSQPDNLETIQRDLKALIAACDGVLAQAPPRPQRRRP